MATANCATHATHAADPLTNIRPSKEPVKRTCRVQWSTVEQENLGKQVTGETTDVGDLWILCLFLVKSNCMLSQQLRILHSVPNFCVIFDFPRWGESHALRMCYMQVLSKQRPSWQRPQFACAEPRGSSQKKGNVKIRGLWFKHLQLD